MKAALAATNAAVKQKELELNALLKSCAKELTKLAGELKVSHQRMSGEVATKLADLKARGLATDIPGLELLLRQKTSVAKEIAAVEQRADERKQCREQRTKFRTALKDVRDEMTDKAEIATQGDQCQSWRDNQGLHCVREIRRRGNHCGVRGVHAGEDAWNLSSGQR